MKSRHEVIHGLSRVGNATCLDFVNTVHSRYESGGGYVETYSELLQWAADGGTISPHLRPRLEVMAKKHPHQARRVHRRAIELRELLYRMFASLARGERVDATDLEALNAWVGPLSSRRQLVRSGLGFQWEWIEEPPQLDAVVWPILDSVVKLLVSEDLGRVKQCPAPDGCGWLFLDVSKNRSRRWCDMRVCGNVSKARRFYRKRSKSSESVD